MRLKTCVVVGAFVALAMLPAPARADWVVTPFMGATFGGHVHDTKVNWGGSLAYMGGGIVGFELDFGYTPDFFEQGPDVDSGIDLIDTSNVTTLMTNLILGAPIGGMDRSVRPYVSGGIGVMRTNVHSTGDFFKIRNNDFGVNVGAGLMGFFSDHVGLRGDVRYFRNLADPDEDNEFDIALGGLDFWRGTVGVAFRF